MLNENSKLTQALENYNKVQKEYIELIKIKQSYIILNDKFNKEKEDN